jgi:7-carboxy-7-deazaguanine synthase
MSEQVAIIPVSKYPVEQETTTTPVTTTEKQMLISEIYPCSQGEGPLTGTPSILIRTSTCNLRCRWTDPKTGSRNICDTPFTSWNPDLNNPMTTQEIYDKTIQVATKKDDGTDRRGPITHAIISGGEPTLWGTDLADLSLGLLVSGFHITIETNGTKYVEINSKQKRKGQAPLDLTGNILFSISPKLASSTPFGSAYEKEHNKLRINYVVLDALLKRYPSYLKFVITSPEDLKEVLEIQKELKLPSQRVFLMPEGITRDEIIEHGPAVNDLCMEYGFRYSPREHVILYNNKRKT